MRSRVPLMLGASLTPPWRHAAHVWHALAGAGIPRRRTTGKEDAAGRGGTSRLLTVHLSLRLLTDHLSLLPRDGCCPSLVHSRILTLAYTIAY